MQFHHTPTHASWVNLIECFFSILGKQGLAHRVDRSTHSLRAFLVQYLANYNEHARALHLDQRPGETPTDYRGDEGVSGDPIRPDRNVTDQE